MTIHKSLFLCLFLVMFLTACGSGGSGGGGDNPEQLTGQFVDSAVGGVRFETSGGGRGFTDSNGTFSYRAGETVQFFIGDIFLGEAAGAAMITPLDLVPGAQDTSNTAVQNIARLVQTLDQNSNPSDGIIISQAIRDAARNLSLDFSLPDFESRATQVLQQIFNSLNETPPMLVSASSAELHMRGTLLGNLAGTYRGTYSGDETGNWEMTVTSDGRITMSIDPDDPAQDGMMSFPTLSLDGSFSGDGLMGNISADGKVSGTWGAPLQGTGTFQGSRATDPAGGQIGGLNLSGPDTTTFLGSRFEPSSGTGSPSLGLSVIWFDTDVVTRAARGLNVTIGDGGNLLFAVFSGGTTGNSWAYTLNCISNAVACTGVTLNSAAQTMQFNNFTLPPDTTVSENRATAPITLNGTLGYTQSTGN